MNHNPDDLITLFNGLFLESHQTVLVRGGHEPEYLPAAGPDAPAQVVFAHGYFASALHEIAHWCIAGEQRRTLYDYGYWYCPDGRTPEQQFAFEQVEVKPQAIECMMALAAGFRFNISVDNLAGSGAANETLFRHNLCLQADSYLANGLPARAQIFFDALVRFYGTGSRIHEDWTRTRKRLTGMLPDFDPSRIPEIL
ncbi:transporting ATPase [Marinobacter fuscus]|uniref:Transporting ATPase n=1 Tax=Marinobacter fuscus TaxID=2109942 RepID=A0A2T1K4E5_9GAMM|nr:elongation factor P hydroxylase [Marinobacter fuscus]PSF04967.1 transporting ATPase [Marinobacter fuscus]